MGVLVLGDDLDDQPRRALGGPAADDVTEGGVSSDARGNMPAQRTDGAWVVNPGAKGQAIASLVVKVGGKGPYVDLGEIEREKEVLRALDNQLVQFEPRLKAATDPES